jgi:ATP-dependent Lon protease
MNKDELRFKSLSLSELIEEESDFFPLLSQEDEDKIDNEKTPKTLPILPLRNTVLFPGVIIPITIGRDRSIKLIKDTYKGNRTIGVLAQ